MRTLLLMRHAKSSWSDPDLTDHQRPLNRRGRNAAVRMGRLLVDEDRVPEFILCSTSERTRETVGLMLPQFANDCSIEFCDDLYHGSPTQIVQAIAAVDDAYGRLLVVAHNPGLEELIGDWSEESLHFPTGAVAEYGLSIPGWSHMATHGTVAYRRLWKPKDLEPLEESRQTKGPQ